MCLLVFSVGPGVYRLVHPKLGGHARRIFDCGPTYLHTIWSISSFVLRFSLGQALIWRLLMKIDFKFWKLNFLFETSLPSGAPTARRSPFTAAASTRVGQGSWESET